MHAPRGVLLGRHTTRYLSLVGLAMHAPERRQPAKELRLHDTSARDTCVAVPDVAAKVGQRQSYDLEPTPLHSEETTLDIQPVLFIQGAGMMHDPDGSGRLAAYLARELSADCRVIAPEMPDADNPHYQPWRDRIEQELQAIDEEAMLIGHSLGGSVLLKYLAEGSYRKAVPGLFLVSVPNWGPDGWAYEEFAAPNDVGSRLLASRIFLYHSRDDPEVPFAHLGYYQERLPMATARPVEGSEHSFVEGLPILLDDIKSLLG